MQTDGDWLWIGTNRGLFKYNGKTEEMKRYRYSTHRSGMLSQAYITDIKLTERGSLIVSTLNGVNVYHRDTDTFSFIRQSGSQDEVTLNCNAINCICTMGETIWLGTETGGVNLLSPKRLQTEFWTCPMMNRSVKSPVNAIAEDSLGHLWLGSWSTDWCSGIPSRIRANTIRFLRTTSPLSVTIPLTACCWIRTGISGLIPGASASMSST